MSELSEELLMVLAIFGGCKSWREAISKYTGVIKFDVGTLYLKILKHVEIKEKCQV